MSTDASRESEYPIFRGEGLKECEQFIAAVNRHARAQGKLRDDQWIADFVAVCLEEDALTWWSSLDEQTQGSWQRLRTAMISQFRLLFYGKSGAEAEDFVTRVRQRALRAGKLNDPHTGSGWIADFVSASFAGSALRWYLSLESCTRGSWNSLQEAILARYPPGFEEGSTAPALPPTRRLVRGQIRARKPNDPRVYYLSKTVYMESGQDGRIWMTFNIAEALEVEYQPDYDGPQPLIIPGNQINGCNQLALKGHVPSDPNDLLVPCGLDSRSGIERLGPIFQGRLLGAAPWKISQSANDRGERSVIGINGTGRPFVTLSTQAHPMHFYCRPAKASGEVDMELFFVPV